MLFGHFWLSAVSNQLSAINLQNKLSKTKTDNFATWRLREKPKQTKMTLSVSRNPEGSGRGADKSARKVHFAWIDFTTLLRLFASLGSTLQLSTKKATHWIAF